MAKKKKVTKKELEQLQELVKYIREIENKIGSLEIEKTNYIVQHDVVQKELNETRSQLKEKYGDINVNLSTGEYEEIKEE